MAPIFTQMRRNSIGTRRNCDLRRADRIRTGPAPRISNCRNVIYIHSKTLILFHFLASKLLI
jgi:hypothetical protein